MITFSKETLREALQGLRVLKLSKQHLPVLRQVLVVADEASVEFTGTDLDQFLTYQCAGASPTPTRILVPYDILNEVAKEADAGSEIKIETESTSLIWYQASGIALNKAFQPVAIDECPPAPISEGISITLPEGVLGSMQEALSCASTDPSRLILNSVYLDAHAVVATDGRQLYRRNSLDLPLPEGAIFPASAVVNILPHGEAAHLWLWSRSERAFAQISAGRWRWITKLVEGRFPNYQQVIPKVDEYGVLLRISEADAGRILSVVPKLPGYKDKDSKVVLSVTEKGAVLRTAPGLPKVHLDLARSELVRNGSADVAFNSRYLLSALQTGMRELHVRDHVCPLVMTDAQRIHMWMPLRDVVTNPEPAKTPVTTSSDQASESPRVVSPEPAVQVPDVSETNVRLTETSNSRTTMVASNNTPVSETSEQVSKSRVPTPRIVSEAPASAADAVQEKLQRLRDLLRDVQGEIGGLQGLLRESTRQFKALERDHENLKKNIRALREVPV